MNMSEQSRPPIGRRRDARLRLDIPAQLITLDGQLTASLADLSQSGAHIRASSRTIHRGDAVLYWMGFEAFGRIVWSTDTEAGLEFDELLAPAVLLQTRMQVDCGRIPSLEQMAYEGARSWYTGYR